MREAVRRMNIVKEITAMIERGECDSETITALTIYPSIAACVSPVLTVDEYLNTPESELDEISKACMELNPHWFKVPDDPDEEKKSEIEQQPSISE